MTEPADATLPEQIAEVKRELSTRKRVYPRFVAAGTLGVSEATRRTKRLEAALRTLEGLNQPGLQV
jgi:hypothetical protein